MTGHWLCAECSALRAAQLREKRAADPERYREKRRAWEAAQKEKGLCKRCRREAVKHGLCAVCYAKQRRYDESARKKRLARTHPLGIKKNRPGVCLWCEAPAVEGFKFCPEHLERKREIAAGMRSHVNLKEHIWLELNDLDLKRRHA